MKKEVTHKSIIREGKFGSTQTTTLCGRMDNSIEDGWNVGEEATCKHCQNAMKTFWGKKIIAQAEEYAKR